MGQNNQYYVLVSRLDNNRLIVVRCGRLWATNFSEAEIEAGKYRDELNRGRKQTNDDWLIVRAVTNAVARTERSFYRFKDNRVTQPNPLDQQPLQ